MFGVQSTVNINHIKRRYSIRELNAGRHGPDRAGITLVFL
jgi:hypothetical protein